MIEASSCVAVVYTRLSACQSHPGSKMTIVIAMPIRRDDRLILDSSELAPIHTGRRRGTDPTPRRGSAPRRFSLGVQ
jgi:hypothetical protein